MDGGGGGGGQQQSEIAGPTREQAVSFIYVQEVLPVLLHEWLCTEVPAEELTLTFGRESLR